MKPKTRFITPLVVLLMCLSGPLGAQLEEAVRVTLARVSGAERPLAGFGG